MENTLVKAFEQNIQILRQTKVVNEEDIEEFKKNEVIRRLIAHAKAFGEKDHSPRRYDRVSSKVRGNLKS